MYKKRIVSIGIVSCMILASISGRGYMTKVSASEDKVKVEREVKRSDSVMNTMAIDFDVEGEVTLTSIDFDPVGEVVVTGVDDESQSVLLEKVLTIVKSKINIPKELTEFNYHYNTYNYNGKPLWYLNWNNKEYSKSISIQVDNEGHITSYNSNQDGFKYRTPKYLKSELIAVSDKFIKTVEPEIYDNLEYVGAGFDGLYSGRYNYTYKRVINGIPMTDNNIVVGVDYNTGKVTAYQSNYLYHIDIPSADDLITKERAKSIIDSKLDMELTYMNRYETDSNGKSKITAFLVYKPNSQYIAVDAKTGKVYTTKNTWDYSEGKKMAETTASARDVADNDNGSGLTREEITKIDELKGLLSKDDAIKVITGNKNLLIDSNAKSITASLFKQYSEEDSNSYAWHINFSDPREVDYNSNDYYRARASAVVDAKTGKIISFYASVKDFNSMTQDEIAKLKINYSSEASKNTLETFLMDQIPDLYKYTVLSDKQTNPIIILEKISEFVRGYNYNYVRVNEGVNYDSNGIYGGVDPITGKIVSFSYNWNNNVTFESPKNVIPKEEAFDYYMDNDNLKLVYEINTINQYNNNGYTISYEPRLVFLNDMNPQLISAFTGKQVDYTGKEYTKEQSYIYKDIKGNSQARNIQLLAEIGIGFEGGSFLPDKAITGEELKNFLSMIGHYDVNSNQALTNKTNITRLDASKLIINLLHYDKIASIKGIYSIDYADKDTVKAENVGVVSIVNGLKFITVDSNNQFRANDNLTRAEVAKLIMGLLANNQ